MSRKKNKPDKILISLIVALVVIGSVALLSASIEQSKQDFGNVYGYFVHQAIYGLLLGGAAGLFLYFFPYKKLKNLALPMLIASIVLLMLVFVPALSVKTGGAQRWVDFGFFTFQPSEIIKLAFIIYMAAWLSAKEKVTAKTETFIAFLVFMGIMGFLMIMQPDLSTLGIIVLTAGAMYFAAGASLKHIAYMTAGGVAAFVVLVQTSTYRLGRVLTFLNPKNDPFGTGYQINQILIAVGAGQIWGTGPLQGVQKNFLPLAMNDSIFAVWAEETGFIGGAILITLFLLLIHRIISLAGKKNDNFAKLTMLGIASWIFIQTAINLGSILGVFPLTGVTLPFVSYGASSLVVVLAASGLLLQLSKQKI